VGADPVSTGLRGIWEPFIDTLHGWRTLGVVEMSKKVKVKDPVQVQVRYFELPFFSL